jgi:hypothetical protein
MNGINKGCLQIPVRKLEGAGVTTDFATQVDGGKRAGRVDFDDVVDVGAEWGDEGRSGEGLEVLGLGDGV